MNHQAFLRFARATALLAAAVVFPPAARADFHRGDFNLDGAVNTNDYFVWFANSGRTSCVPNPDVVLTRSLVVAPDRRTVLPAEAVHFTAAGSTGFVNWAFATNRTGAALTNAGASAADYQAGLTATNVDIVEAWTVDDYLGRSFINVIGSNDVAQLGKAVILAGGKELNDPVWLATDYLADTAFNTLRYRGFAKANLQYLSRQPGQDVDGDGVATNDIDLATSFANAAETFTNWVGSANRLFVYLVDHGEYSAGLGYFRLTPSELLSATQLDLWLDRIQSNANVDVTVLLDFCYAGAFASGLTWTGAPRRTVIAACSTNELTYFLAGGLASFSSQFFGLMLQGASVGSAFAGAQQGMSGYQHAILQDPGNAATNYIGATFVAGKDIPIIGTVLGPQVLTDGTAAQLWAGDIATYYPLQRVWCSIVPPRYAASTNSGIPVVDIPEVELAFNPAVGRYEGTFEGFAEEGIYQVSYFARDIWNSVSLPRASQVQRAALDERLIFVAGGDTNAAAWPAELDIARLGLTVFRSRHFAETNRMLFLCAATNVDLTLDGTNDVGRAATIANLRDAITNWANPSQRLTLYLSGMASNNALQLNAGEWLGGAQLASWLDLMQLTTRVVNVVMDFPGCGACVTNLAPPAGRERLVLASTMAGYDRLNRQQGQVSFSRYFLGEIFGGRTIGQAFATAKKAIRRVSGALRQRAQLEDSGNGVPNERNVDGAVAAGRYIGAAFLTGADAPNIGRVVPPAVLVATNEAVVWAADVTDAEGITQVWCVVTEPGYDGTNGLYATNLAYNAGSNRYEGTLFNLTNAGTYGLTFYAMDGASNVSPAVQSELVRADAYEVDDASTNASTYYGPAQLHTMHASNDVDWVQFFAASNFAYDVETIHLGTNVDTVLEVYREETNGTLTLVDSVDDFGREEGELVGLDFPASGLYYARVSQVASNGWAPGSYEVSITIPAGGGQVIVVGRNKLTKGPLPAGAIAMVGAQSQTFGGDLYKTFNVGAGTYTVLVTNVPAGYLPDESPSLADQSQNPYSVQYGNPQLRSVESDPNAVVYVYVGFMPHSRVIGTVRDAWTGDWVPGAAIWFRARNGAISNAVFDRRPWGAVYAMPWTTSGDGSFPTNVWLPTVDWDLTVQKTGYSNRQVAAALTGLTVGAVVGSGEHYLTPLDTNANGVADSWEQANFPGGAAATNDADGDGLSNRDEYWAGTQPTNAGSVFRGSGWQGATNGFALSWPVAAGRTYRVRATDGLLGSNWVVVGGPWTAQVGQVSMGYTETNPPAASPRLFQVQIGGP